MFYTRDSQGRSSRALDGLWKVLPRGHFVGCNRSTLLTPKRFNFIFGSTFYIFNAGFINLFWSILIFNSSRQKMDKEFSRKCQNWSFRIWIFWREIIFAVLVISRSKNSPSKTCRNEWQLSRYLLLVVRLWNI